MASVEEIFFNGVICVGLRVFLPFVNRLRNIMVMVANHPSHAVVPTVGISLHEQVSQSGDC